LRVGRGEKEIFYGKRIGDRGRREERGEKNMVCRRGVKGRRETEKGEMGKD